MHAHSRRLTVTLPPRSQAEEILREAIACQAQGRVREASPEKLNKYSSKHPPNSQGGGGPRPNPTTPPSEDEFSYHGAVEGLVAQGERLMALGEFDKASAAFAAAGPAFREGHGGGLHRPPPPGQQPGKPPPTASAPRHQQSLLAGAAGELSEEVFTPPPKTDRLDAARALAMRRHGGGSKEGGKGHPQASSERVSLDSSLDSKRGAPGSDHGSHGSSSHSSCLPEQGRIMIHRMPSDAWGSFEVQTETPPRASRQGLLHRHQQEEKDDVPPVGLISFDPEVPESNDHRSTASWIQSPVIPPRRLALPIT